MVLRAMPVLRAISRIGTLSRKCHRLMLLNIATFITPVTPAQILSREVLHVGQIRTQFTACDGSPLSAIQQW